MAKNNQFEPDNGDYVSLIQKLNANSSANASVSKEAVKARLDGKVETSSLFGNSALDQKKIDELSASIYTSDSYDNFSYEKIKQSHNASLKDLTAKPDSFKSLNQDKEERLTFGKAIFDDKGNSKSTILDNSSATKRAFARQKDNPNLDSMDPNISITIETIDSGADLDSFDQDNTNQKSSNINANKHQPYQSEIFYGNAPRNRDRFKRARQNYKSQAASSKQEAIAALEQEGITYPKAYHTPFIAFGLFFSVVSFFGELEGVIKTIVSLAGALGVIVGLIGFITYRGQVRAYNAVVESEQQKIDSKLK